MSQRLQRAVWLHAPIAGSRLLVLQALAELADERGQVIASHKQIRMHARVGRMTTIRALDRLRHDEWLLRSRSRQHGRVNVYVLNLPRLERVAVGTCNPSSRGAKT